MATTMTVNSYVDEDPKHSDRRYQRFLKKAEVYLTKYQATHGSLDVATSGGVDGAGTRHLDFMKKAHGFFHKKEERSNGDHELSKTDDKKENGEPDHKEYPSLATAMLKKIHKHKKQKKKFGKHHGGGGHGEGEGEGEEESSSEEEEMEEVEAEVEEGEEGGWFSQLLEGIGSIAESFEE